MDHLSELPLEIQMIVFKQLLVNGIKDLASLALVSKQFNRLIRDSFLDTKEGCKSITNCCRRHCNLNIMYRNLSRREAFFRSLADELSTLFRVTTLFEDVVSRTKIATDIVLWTRNKLPDSTSLDGNSGSIFESLGQILGTFTSNLNDTESLAVYNYLFERFNIKEALAKFFSNSEMDSKRSKFYLRIFFQELCLKRPTERSKSVWLSFILQGITLATDRIKILLLIFPDRLVFPDYVQRKKVGMVKMTDPNKWGTNLREISSALNCLRQYQSSQFTHDVIKSLVIALLKHNVHYVEGLAHLHEALGDQIIEEVIVDYFSDLPDSQGHPQNILISEFLARGLPKFAAINESSVEWFKSIVEQFSSSVSLNLFAFDYQLLKNTITC